MKSLIALALALLSSLASGHGLEDDGHVSVEEFQPTVVDYALLSVVTVAVAAALFFTVRKFFKARN